MDGGFCVLGHPAYLRHMPHLPNHENAIVDVRKLSDYCLNPRHPRGRHKARVFRDSLGLSERDALWLRDALIEGLKAADAELQANDRFGTRWRVDIAVRRHGAEAVVRTIWIIRTGEQQPRLVTCWVV